MRSLRRLTLLLIAATFLPGVACGRRATVPTPQTGQPAPQTPAPAPGTVPAPAAPPLPGTTPAIPPAAQPGATAPAAPGSTGVPPAVTAPAGPLIRIGLDTSAQRIEVTASGEFTILEKRPEAASQRVRGPIEIRLESGSGRGIEEIYRVQVASLSRREAADQLRQRLSDQLSVTVIVNESSAGLFQVRAGEFDSRAKAQDFAAGTIRQQGFADAFVVREEAPARGGSPTLALRGLRDLFRLNPAGYLIYPSSPTEFLRLNGKPYRGILDVSLSRGGRITVVNQLEMEDYLYGVVPAEMSPTTYPHPAALAAQAIAARTYALKNLGRFKSDGFDLTNDDRTQVYGGVAAEKKPTNEAVRSTRGLVLYYQGRPIEAMYTSTCGGRTEDFSAVFDTAPVPYLRSVVCAVEAAMPATNDGGLVGSHLLTQVVLAGDGRIANREIELATLLGLAPAGPGLNDTIEEPAEADEIRRWTAAAGSLLRREVPSRERGGSTMSNAGFVHLAVAATVGREAAERTISKADADYYLANVRDGSEVPEDARASLAFAMQKGLWAGFPDHTVRPHDPVLRKDALVILVRLVLFTRPEILNEAALAAVEASTESARGRALNLKWGSRNRTVLLAENVRLFQRVQERSAPAENLVLIGNERLSFHLDSEGRIDFLEAVLNPTGAASDRFSPVASWHVTLTRAQVAQKLQPLAPAAGELLDLEPEKIGASGRVVSFRIRGNRQSVVVNGYRVRGALGLRDTLLTIRRAAGPDGRIESFTFDGRGFGHGVGMCQVGAYGMAQAGRSYEEILKTYYQGVDLARAY